MARAAGKVKFSVIRALMDRIDKAKETASSLEPEMVDILKKAHALYEETLDFSEPDLDDMDIDESSVAEYETKIAEFEAEVVNRNNLAERIIIHFKACANYVADEEDDDDEKDSDKKTKKRKKNKKRKSVETVAEQVSKNLFDEIKAWKKANNKKLISLESGKVFFEGWWKDHPDDKKKFYELWEPKETTGDDDGKGPEA